MTDHTSPQEHYRDWLDVENMPGHDPIGIVNRVALTLAEWESEGWKWGTVRLGPRYGHHDMARNAAADAWRVAAEAAVELGWLLNSAETAAREAEDWLEIVASLPGGGRR